MSLLEQIPLHDTAIFNFDEVPYEKNHKYIKSYHHCIADFLPYHTHDFFEINIVFSGVGLHRLENRDILTRQGDIFVIPPNMKHGYSCHKDLNVFHILLSHSFIDVFLPLLEKMVTDVVEELFKEGKLRSDLYVRDKRFCSIDI